MGEGEDKCFEVPKILDAYHILWRYVGVTIQIFQFFFVCCGRSARDTNRVESYILYERSVS